MIIANVITKMLNVNLRANPNIARELQKFATKIVELRLPLFNLNLLITPEGYLDLEEESADCSITIPLASAAHLIHQDEVQTFQQLHIEGDANLARNFLTALSKIQPSNVLYNHNSALLGIMAVKLEAQLNGLFQYLALLANNASYSTSQYIQYEIDFVTDKFTLDKFNDQVDELKDRCQLLAKRVERILAK